MRKRAVAFSHAMKLTWPKPLPLTTTWFDVTSTASAISGFDTEKRSIGRSKLISLDWPTSTLTAIGSLSFVNEALYVVSWPCAIDIVTSIVIGAKKQRNRPLSVLGVVLFIIITPSVFGASLSSQLIHQVLQLSATKSGT